MLGGLSQGGQTAIQNSQSPVAPPSPQQQGMLDAGAFFSGLHAPELALIDQQSGQIAAQIGNTQAQYGLATGALQQNTALDLQKLGLGPQYDAIQRNANNRQIGGLNDLDNLAWQALGNTAKGFDIAEKDAWFNAGKQGVAARSDATVRGAMSGRGIHRTLDNIQYDLASQLENIGVQREGARLQAEEGFMTRKEQKAQLEDRNKTLDIKAKEYGISGQQLKANLSQGLSKLGLDQMMDVNQLLDALNSNDLEKLAVANQIVREALTYSDFFTTLPAPAVPSGTGMENLTVPQQQQVGTGMAQDWVSQMQNPSTFGF